MPLIVKILIGFLCGLALSALLYHPLGILMRLYVCHKMRWHSSCNCCGNPDECEMECVDVADEGDTVAQEIMQSALHWDTIAHMILSALSCTIFIGICVAFM